MTGFGLSLPGERGSPTTPDHRPGGPFPTGRVTLPPDGSCSGLPRGLRLPLTVGSMRGSGVWPQAQSAQCGPWTTRTLPPSGVAQKPRQRGVSVGVGERRVTGTAVLLERAHMGRLLTWGRRAVSAQTWPCELNCLSFCYILYSKVIKIRFLFHKDIFCHLALRFILS